jgi:magnesium-protoporphyrin IX monomethyl ester (oxidative) cyclase
VWRSKTPEQTGDEVETLVRKYGYKNIGFLDQHFTINREYVYGFLKEVERRRLRFNWFCDSRVEAAELDFFRDMRRSGLRRVLFGVEHVNQKIL